MIGPQIDEHFLELPLAADGAREARALHGATDVVVAHSQRAPHGAVTRSRPSRRVDVAQQRGGVASQQGEHLAHTLALRIAYAPGVQLLVDPAVHAARAHALDLPGPRAEREPVEDVTRLLDVADLARGDARRRGDRRFAARGRGASGGQERDDGAARRESHER